MIKAIFVDPTKSDGIESSGANYLMVAQQGINKGNWIKLKNLRIRLSISVNAFGPDGCPANPKAQEKLFEKISAALDFNPIAIWIDHFRFDGHWESIENNRISGIHQDCRWCTNKSRAKVLKEIAKKIIKLVNKRAKVGYFAVPFKTKEVPQLVSDLGQDHRVIGKIFDMSSPMLYHRMIKKSVGYISEYVRYLHNLTKKNVLPIIQIKTMPDDSEDKLSKDEIYEAFNEAKKPPSVGVAFFWWTHALEKTDAFKKGKTGIISHLFQT